MTYRRSHTSSECLCAIAHDLEKKSYHLSETEDIQAEGQMKNEDVQDKAHGPWLRAEVTTFVQDLRHSSVRQM